MPSSVNFCEFIGLRPVTFNIAVQGLIFVYSFFLDRIPVSSVPRATVRTLKLKKTLKT